MDPRHLNRDELEIELEIRDILNDGKAETISQLYDRLKAEANGELDVPNKLHKCRTVTSECSEIDSRLAIIENDIKEHLVEMQTKDVERIISRLYHYKGRISRITCHQPTYLATWKPKLENVVQSIRYLENVIKSLGSSTVNILDPNNMSTPYGSTENILNLSKHTGTKPKRSLNKSDKVSDNTNKKNKDQMSRVENIVIDNPVPPLIPESCDDRVDNFEGYDEATGGIDLIDRRQSLGQRSADASLDKTIFANIQPGRHALIRSSSFSTRIAINPSNRDINDFNVQAPLSPEIAPINKIVSEHNRGRIPNLGSVPAKLTFLGNTSSKPVQNDVSRHLSQPLPVSSEPLLPRHTDSQFNLPKYGPSHPSSQPLDSRQRNSQFSSVQSHPQRNFEYVVPPSINQNSNRTFQEPQIREPSASTYNQHYPPRREFRSSTYVDSFKRWNIKFDGTKNHLAVEEFLFRIESQAIADNVPPNNLAAHIHEFLSSKALDWYWLYRRSSPFPNWTQIRDALLAEFRSQETDYEIRQAMLSRTQRPNESFSDYRLGMQGLASRLESPMSQSELIEIVRRNMNPRLQNALLLHDITSLEHLRDLARKFEKLWTETNTRSRSHHVSEVYPAYSRSLFNEIDQEPNYLQDIPSNDNHINNSWPTENYSTVETNQHVRETPEEDVSAINQTEINKDNWICWNCDAKGHTFRECTIAQRNFFCFKCGLKGVVTPICKNCNSGNLKSNGRNSGAFRLMRRSPEARKTTQSPQSTTRPKKQ